MISVLIFIILCLFFVFFLVIYKTRSQTTKIWQKAILSSRSDYTKVEHKWSVFDTKGLYYCNFCKKLLGGWFDLQSLECKKCGVLAHVYCYRQKKNLKCKYTVSSKDTSFSSHQWVDGNLPVNSVCSACELVCTSYYDLEGSTCIWCQRVVHHECKEKINEICDFGVLKKTILCPNEVNYFSKRDSRDLKKEELPAANSKDNKIVLKRKKSSEAIWKFSIPESKIIIVVVVNKKSGGQVGERFLNSFYRYLNPLQVVDLLDEGLEKLKVFANSNIKELRVVVGGGDGTIGSVANFLKTEVPEWVERNPPIAPLPLGTGNDLSRAMGWGGTFTTIDVKTYLQQVGNSGHKLLLDRWIVDITFNNEKVKNKNFIMNNYCGIGLDAKIALSFHNLREKSPSLFQSRIGNKFIYGHLGAVDFLVGKRNLLSKNLTLTCDGNKIKLPDIENIIILNINYWGGGVYNLWGNQIIQNPHNIFSETANSDTSYSENTNNEYTKHFVEQSFSDGILEVIGVQSALHLGQCQVGFSSPIRLCQGKAITLEMKINGKQPIQIDGEPFEISGPFQVTFTYKDKVAMLGRKIEPNYIIESKILNVLDWAENNNHISNKQKEILLDRFSETLTKNKKIKT